MSLPLLLSLITFLPLLGAAGHPVCVAASAGANARWIALITTIVDFALVAGDLGAVRSANRRLPVRRASTTGWAAASPITWAWTAFPCCSSC